jgi:serine protease Do
VPVKVVRDKKALTLNVKVGQLDLAQETGAQGSIGAAPKPTKQPSPQMEPKSTAFGLTITDLTAALAQRLNLPEGRTGAVVTGVEPRSSGARAGLGAGDLIVRVNGKAVTTRDQATAALEATPSGGAAEVVIVRAGREQLLLLRNR